MKMHFIISIKIILFLSAILIVPTIAGAQQIVGWHHPLTLETPHPVPVNVRGDKGVWKDVIRHKGATYISVHFEKFDLNPGARVVISSPYDPYSFTFTGKGVLEKGNFWATHVYGDTAIIELYSEVADPGFGYVIDKYSAGFTRFGMRQDKTRSICGEDDKRHIVCYKWTEPAAYDRARAVAALLTHWDTRDPGLDRFCTGSLISCDGYLLTCEHCIPEWSLAADTTFEFMAEAPNCNDPNPPEEWWDPFPPTDPPYPSGFRFTGAIQILSNWDFDYGLEL